MVNRSWQKRRLKLADAITFITGQARLKRVVRMEAEWIATFLTLKIDFSDWTGERHGLISRCHGES